MSKGLLLIISGPSGVGKGTVIEVLKKKIKTELNRDSYLSVSMTTRAPRPGEIDGVHYHFVDRHTFLQAIYDGGFAEHEEFAGNLYGTPRAPIHAHCEAGDIVLFDIEVKGASRMREAFPEAVSVFITPPSPEELKRRIIGRGTNTPEEIERRLAIGVTELARANEFHYQVCNTDVETCVNNILEIIRNHINV